MPLLVQMLTFSAFFAASTASAEYRAYRLKISDTTTGSEKMIITTYDHLQYRGYFPLTQSQTVSLDGTWRCKGNTGQFLPICPDPKAQ